MSSPKTGKEEVADICDMLQKNKPFAFGIAITAIYLIGLCCYLIKKWDGIIKMDPNNLGDFLAGAFGPLAFAWLVLGYFQQGKELKQNNKALQLQATELKNAVEQYENMAIEAKNQSDVLKNQFKNDIEARKFENDREEMLRRPHFVANFVPFNSGLSQEKVVTYKYFELFLMNLGADCAVYSVSAFIKEKNFSSQLLGSYVFQGIILQGQEIRKIFSPNPAMQEVEMFNSYITILYYDPATEKKRTAVISLNERPGDVGLENGFVKYQTLISSYNWMKEVDEFEKSRNSNNK